MHTLGHVRKVVCGLPANGIVTDFSFIPQESVPIGYRNYCLAESEEFTDDLKVRTGRGCLQSIHESPKY